MMWFRKHYGVVQVIYFIDGVAYRWSGWFGCQLESMEWRMLPAGSTRDFSIGLGKQPIKMRVFTTERHWLKVRTTWALPSNGTLDEHSARIRDLRAQLQEHF